MKRNTLTFIGIFAFSVLCFSQSIYFRHLNIQNGLSNPSISCFYQDEFGFIWIGTREGLNRYDGSQIKNLYSSTDESTTISAVQSICGDNNGAVYITSRGSVLKYDSETETLARIGNKNFSFISYGKNGLMALSDDDIFSYDTKKTEFTLFTTLNDKSIIPNAILQDRSGNIYVGTTNKGLFIIDKNKKSANFFPTKDIIKIYEDSKGFIWLCTRNSGLLQIEKSGKVVRYFRQGNELEYSLSGEYVRDIAEDTKGNMWIGTQYGLDKFDAAQNRFIHFKHSRENIYGISNSSIYSILCDKQGNIWVGSYYGGIDYFNPDLSFYQFNDYYQKFSTTIFNEIVEDKRGNLWVINGGGGGLYYFDRKRNDIIYKGLSKSIIKTILLDENNNAIWLGTIRHGLYKMGIKTGKMTLYKHKSSDKESLHDDQIRRIVRSQKTLYLATNNSVGMMDIEKERFSVLFESDSLLNHRHINDMLIDHGNNLWFCTNDNIFKYNIETKKLSQFSYNNAILFTLFLDNQGILWCGTSNCGLLKIDAKGDITSFSPKNSGLNSYNIIDLNESKSGYLIIATPKGLSWMNKQDNSFNNVDYDTFLPLQQVNEDGITVTSEGSIFLSGINGLFEFKEIDVFNKKVFSSPIVLTELYVNNRLVTPSDEDKILSVGLPSEKTIKLKHHHTTFTIYFTLLDYTSPEKDVKYKLEGFDKEWISISSERKIMYSNLAPGSYLLKMKNGRTDVTRNLQVIVSPPFYKTWLAYFIYLIILASITYLILSNYTSRVKLQTSLTYSRREKEQIEELNQAKLRFFTNISHEFRTPLTLIIGHVEMLLQNGNIVQSIYTKLTKILSNAHRMQRLISELIEFRKQEQGFLKLKVAEYDIVHFLDEICNSFKEYSLFRKVNLFYFHQEESLVVWFDADQMEKVFYNLLSNAFKNTPSGGTITIELLLISNKIFVKVSDTGRGIDKESIDKIFNRFYQVDYGLNQAEIGPGSGIGLALTKNIVKAHGGNISVESEVEQGTVFTVELLLGENHFTEEERRNMPYSSNAEIHAIPPPDSVFIDKSIETQKENETMNSIMLIVEDNTEMLNMLCSLFIPYYKVVKTTNGEEGLLKAIEIQPNIILSDVFMPKMSGIEMCAQLKSNADTCHIPIVLLTAQSASEYIIQGLEQGADDYIMKPFDSRLLITRCNNLVNSRKSIQKHFLTDLSNSSVSITHNTYDRKFLENAIRIIEENYDNQEFNVKHLSKELALSKSILYVKLKGITGETVNDFIQNIKLKKSVQYLLENPEQTIAEIAYKFGFNYPSYYIKCFKNLFGETPTQYRKNKLK